jgi:hypothetical protein
VIRIEVRRFSGYKQGGTLYKVILYIGRSPMHGCSHPVSFIEERSDYLADGESGCIHTENSEMRSDRIILYPCESVNTPLSYQRLSIS